MIFEPRIALRTDLIPPDSYDDSMGLIPPDDFVVSRFPDRTVASRYMDMSWNRTPYDPDGHPSWLRFPFWEFEHITQLTPTQESLTREVHWFMFLLTWKRRGVPLAFLTLTSYMSLFNDLSDFAQAKACKIKDILSNEAHIVEFICSGIPARTISLLASLISFLLQLGPKESGLVVPGGKLLRQLRKQYNQSRKRSRQTPPIPTRIYSRVMANLLCELEDFEKIAHRYFAMLTQCINDPLIGRSANVQRAKIRKLGLRNTELRSFFGQLLKEYDLEEYFATKQLCRDINGLSSGLSNVQMVAKLLIQTFSGMRDEESTELPFHCLITSVSGGRTHVLLAGRTTKLNEGLYKRTKWATSREGKKAVLVAQRVATAIYESIGETPEPDDERINNYPLFVSTAYLPSSSISMTKGHRGFLAGGCKLAHFKALKLRFLPNIEETDLQELEQIDPHRAWRSEDPFQIGFKWPFTTHQLRRSLALYAQRSGLVSLPSLRRQLQHITEEMSRYYARGSAYAKNFIGGDRQHFGFEWQKTAPVSAALSYILNVLHTDEILFGGHANWLERHMKSADGIVWVDREKTIRRFKKGELSYRETSLGGCTNINECKQVALKWLDVECVANCTNLVGKLSKLEGVIVVQEKWVKGLDQASMEYRMEKEDLSVLVAARDMVIARKRCKEGVVAC